MMNTICLANWLAHLEEKKLFLTLTRLNQMVMDQDIVVVPIDLVAMQLAGRGSSDLPPKKILRVPEILEGVRAVIVRYTDPHYGYRSAPGWTWWNWWSQEPQVTIGVVYREYHGDEYFGLNLQADVETGVLRASPDLLETRFLLWEDILRYESNYLIFRG